MDGVYWYSEDRASLPCPDCGEHRDAHRYVKWRDREGRRVSRFLCPDERCCQFDHNGDGNCHLHLAPGLYRAEVQEIVNGG